MAFDAQEFLQNTPNKPGVYQMLNADDKIIYVGKAKNLKKRLQSYFRTQVDSAKTQLMVSKVAKVQFTVTASENEALILENNLIKQFKPKYNILMRDDKSYPYIVLSKHSVYPRLSSYRGTQRKGQTYFGPYPNVGAVKESLYLLQKLFRIRSCTDTYFKNRTRPCLQYQIKRCSGPCVNLISQKDYQNDVAKAVLFLKGKNKTLIKQLQLQMQQAASQLDYEQAALLRDQIDKLKDIQLQQHVMAGKGNFDIVVILQQLEQTGIGLITVRDGKLLGNKSFFPKAKAALSDEILYAFLTQHYLSADFIPKSLLVNIEPQDKEWLSSALSEYSGHNVDISVPQKGDKKQWLQLALDNCAQSLATHVQTTLSQKKRLQVLQQVLALPHLPKHMECFDISHSQGEATVASCVVFNEEGPDKKNYRRFNIKDVAAGDDYAALKQAVSRRYTRLLKSEQPLPDLVIIDGGKGQLQQAIDVFNELQIDSTQLLSISKGTGRKADFDVLWRPGQKQPISLESDSIALHLVQQIRDEAHRFAITGHKAQRGKQRQHSILEDIEGIGAKRRRELLKRFSGLQGLQQASVDEIAAVSGISAALAIKIYQHLH